MNSNIWLFRILVFLMACFVGGCSINSKVPQQNISNSYQSGVSDSVTQIPMPDYNAQIEEEKQSEDNNKIDNSADENNVNKNEEQKNNESNESSNKNNENNVKQISSEEVSISENDPDSSCKFIAQVSVDVHSDDDLKTLKSKALADLQNKAKQRHANYIKMSGNNKGFTEYDLGMKKGIIAIGNAYKCSLSDNKTKKVGHYTTDKSSEQIEKTGDNISNGPSEAEQKSESLDNINAEQDQQQDQQDD